MEAKELRIGGFVLLEGYLHQITLWDFACLDRKDYKESDYSPIELTKEWYDKFEQKDLDLFVMEVHDNWGVMIKFVHQLQNFHFLLIEEELTIKE